MRCWRTLLLQGKQGRRTCYNAAANGSFALAAATLQERTGASKEQGRRSCELGLGAGREQAAAWVTVHLMRHLVDAAPAAALA